MERVNRLERYQVGEQKSLKKELEEATSIRVIYRGSRDWRMEIREWYSRYSLLAEFVCALSKRRRFKTVPCG
jgi:hypothetical protein